MEFKLNWLPEAVLFVGPDNGDKRSVCKEHEEGEEEVEKCGFFFLLLGDSVLQADRSSTFKDLLALVLDALWNGEGMLLVLGTQRMGLAG